MSRFHRVDDMMAMHVDRFVPLVLRLSAYGGLMTMHAAAVMRQAKAVAKREMEPVRPQLSPSGKKRSD